MKDNTVGYLPTSESPLTSSNTGKYTSPDTKAANGFRARFNRSLTSLFGFRKSSPNSTSQSRAGIDFVKVDSESDMRLAQAKIGKTFQTKLVGKLDTLFNAWMQDTTDTYAILEDRSKRLAELEFAIANDPFLSMAANLYADESTQIDVQGKLIAVECADPRMKSRIEDLFNQWGITQNRLRSIAYQLAAYGDAFWANKITKNGVVRINPIGIHQVKERLEFNPVQVQSDLSLRKGYITAINRSAKLKALFDLMDSDENEEFADLFDTRLFGFVIEDDMVVPPWAITHFRLNADQSEFFPMGKSFLLHCLAPFRQCNATMVLQGLARVMNMPVTVYNVKTAPGMDEAMQFDKINEVREEYENIGDSGAGSEAYSVNTKIWAPEGLLGITMHSPNIDLNAIGDLELYQDRVAIASGIPKGYLVQEYGGFGNSAISLVEQSKPFGRRVYTVQSSILEGLSNLVRLHFAITGDFNYKEPFVLSMKFPNEESATERIGAKEETLTLTKDVLDLVANVIGAINDPLPEDVIQDIIAKFSFLDPDDIKKWIKYNPNKKKEDASAEEFDGEDGGFGGGGAMGGGMSGGGGADFPDSDFGGPEEAGAGTEGDNPFGDLEPEVTAEGGVDMTSPEDDTKEEAIRHSKWLMNKKRLSILTERYIEASDEISEAVNNKILAKLDETISNNRHWKYAHVESCQEPIYRLLAEDFKNKGNEAVASTRIKEATDEKFTWSHIKENILKSDQPEEELTYAQDEEVAEPEESTEDYDGEQDDEIRTKNILTLM